jgi:Ca-activated chloride channel family protein
MRYKLPGETESRLIETPIGRDLVHASLDATPEDMRFAAAVAAFGQKLRGSDAVATMDYAEIAALAQAGRGEDEAGYRGEFIQLVRTADLVGGSNRP